MSSQELPMRCKVKRNGRNGRCNGHFRDKQIAELRESQEELAERVTSLEADRDQAKSLMATEGAANRPRKRDLLCGGAA